MSWHRVSEGGLADWVVHWSVIVVGRVVMLSDDWSLVMSHSVVHWLLDVSVMDWVTDQSSLVGHWKVVNWLALVRVNLNIVRLWKSVVSVMVVVVMGFNWVVAHIAVNSLMISKILGAVVWLVNIMVVSWSDTIVYAVWLLLILLAQDAVRLLSVLANNLSMSLVSLVNSWVNVVWSGL